MGSNPSKPISCFSGTNTDSIFLDKSLWNFIKFMRLSISLLTNDSCVILSARSRYTVPLTRLRTPPVTNACSWIHKWPIVTSYQALVPKSKTVTGGLIRRQQRAISLLTLLDKLAQALVFRNHLFPPLAPLDYTLISSQKESILLLKGVVFHVFFYICRYYWFKTRHPGTWPGWTLQVFRTNTGLSAPCSASENLLPSCWKGYSYVINTFRSKPRECSSTYIRYSKYKGGFFSFWFLY